MTTLAVSFDWRPAGRVSLDSAGGLVFPVLPTAPGLYRFWIESADPRPGVYIGEAADLRQRMRQYRAPGGSPRTNSRLNMLLKDAVGGGSLVTVWVSTAAAVRLDADEEEPLDLSRHAGRLIAEQAALLAAAVEDLSESGEPPLRLRILNRPGVGEPEYD